MFIYFILTCVSTGLSLVVLKSSGTRWNSVSKAVFNYTHWALIWTILFVYSIQVSTFAVFFGQFFKRGKLFIFFYLKNKFYYSFVCKITWLCSLDYNIY